MRIVPEMLYAVADLQLSLRKYFPEFGVNNIKYVIKSIRQKKETTNLSIEKEQLTDLQNTIFNQSTFAQPSVD